MCSMPTDSRTGAPERFQGMAEQRACWRPRASKTPTPHQIRVLTNGLTHSLMNNRGTTVETVGEGSPVR